MPSPPAYMQVVLFLREQILTGEITEVPGIPFLRNRFNVSQTTVSNAYKKAENDGLIHREPYERPMIAARVEPFDDRYIAAFTPDGRVLFCRKCWEPVNVAPGGLHVCQ